MRIVLFGTPPEAALALEALHGAGHDVALVVTQPDRRRGRGGDLAPSPVKRAALDLGLEVRTPRRAAEVVDELHGSGAVLGVVVAFGQILSREVIDALPAGLVNVHFSLLPRWRGAAPVERAILAGDDETGVCLMEVVEELDAGPVYACERVPIGPDDTAGQLGAELARRGVELLLEHVEEIPVAEPRPQHGEPTYARKLEAEEFRLDWGRPAEELARVVRAGNPRPGAWTTAGERRLKVWRARAEGRVGEAGRVPPGRLLDGPAVATGAGTLRLEEVQFEGKARLSGEEWFRGVSGRFTELR